MGKLARRKILLFGFIAVLLVGIPVSLFIVQQNQNNATKAEKATKLSFVPDSSATTPISKQLDDPIALDINVDPGTNIVSYMKLEIQYDETKLATAEADALKINETAFPVTLEGPTFSPGKISVTISVGSDPTKAIQTITKAATINFKAIGETGDTPTNVTYGNTTEILSLGSNDQASENVLLSVNPAVITIGQTTTSGTPSDAPTITTAPTLTTVPTTATEPTVVPTTVTEPTGVGTSNQVPVCQGLNLDRDTTGGAPYAVTFTSLGTDADGTISKVTFNYGDGPVETVTTSGGIGTNTISVQKAHTYNNPGTYQASAILTDNIGGVSDANTCTKTIIVLAPTLPSGNTDTGNTNVTPLPTISPTGPGDLFVGLSALAGVLTIIGGIIFFAL
jgi:hypothetical protein